jgi:valyl-tRNA synthetase
LALSFNETDLHRLIQDNHYLDRKDQLQLVDCWILSRLHKTIDTVTKALNEFHLNEAVDNLYSFFWREYCDWYLELIKPRLYGDDPLTKDLALGIGIYTLRNILKLLHPFIPFITEEVWHSVKLREEKDLIVSEWPIAEKKYFNDQAEKQLVLIQQVIGAVRNIRGEMNVPPNKKAHLLIRSNNNGNLDLIKQNEAYLISLSKLSEIKVGTELTKPRFSASSVIADLEIFVPLKGLIDIEVERNRLTKEITRLEKQIESIASKLMNTDFIAKAPKEVVERERQKSYDFKANLTKLQTNLHSLES